MNERIKISIDVTKVPKDKIVERRFTNSQGHEVVARELKMEVVALKPESQKVIKSGDTWELVKTHFVALEQTKEEKEAKKNSAIVGAGVMFRNKAVVDTQTDNEEPPF
jgi:hypothetical protein